MREVQEKRHRETKRDEGSGTETQVNPEREKWFEAETRVSHVPANPQIVAASGEGMD